VTITVVRVSFMDARAPVVAAAKKIVEANFMLSYKSDTI
jgi:hypothetical protein